jgi:hypothetical protein
MCCHKLRFLKPVKIRPPKLMTLLSSSYKNKRYFLSVINTNPLTRYFFGPHSAHAPTSVFHQHNHNISLSKLGVRNPRLAAAAKHLPPASSRAQHHLRDHVCGYTPCRGFDKCQNLYKTKNLCIWLMEAFRE